jgi:hypothetical protein
MVISPEMQSSGGMDRRQGERQSVTLTCYSLRIIIISRWLKSALDYTSRFQRWMAAHLGSEIVLVWNARPALCHLLWVRVTTHAETYQF